jgi:hypothetical protein
MFGQVLSETSFLREKVGKQHRNANPLANVIPEKKEGKALRNASF